MRAALGIQERHVGPVTILELSDWLVAGGGDDRYKEHVATLVRAGHLNLLVGMANVTYVDSGGVGVLVGTLLHVSRRGGRLKLLAPSARVARVLEITGLHRVFEVFEHEEDAVASFEPMASH
ncbi:hypothetical protein BH23ACI1_BH23ACI1_31390 [soil metagenome]|nr:STAS domain-containing protein [Acidobacteriota bacterium]